MAKNKSISKSVKTNNLNTENKKKNVAIYRQEKDSRILKRIMRSILEETYDKTAVAFIVLATFGKVTTKMFLKPSYYVDDPGEILWAAEEFKQSRLEKKEIQQTLARLKKYGLVRENKGEFTFTAKSKKIVKKLLGYRKVLKEEWDRKYRVVIFDIPEDLRHHRNWLRGELYFLGYTKLQQSVFISKYSLTEELIKEIKERGIERGVNYLLVEHVYDLEQEKMDIKV